MQAILAYFEKKSKIFLVVLGLILVTVIFVLDYVTGPDLSFLIFYLIPVFLVSWFAGRSPGILVSASCAIAWVVADVMTRHEYSGVFTAFWNVIVKFSVFFSIAYVVSALKRVLIREIDLNTKLQTTVNDLKSANKELEAFNYSVSHDLRTPLVVIGGFTRRLLKEYQDKLDGKGRETLDIIKTNSQKMLQLIDGLLAFSRSGRQDIKSSTIDMDELSEGICKELTQLADERTIKFHTHPLPPAYGDKLLLRQVFYNLLTNAIKFTRQKSEAIIEIGGITEGNENIYYVKDNGIGFDMQYKEKLFNSFQRLHSADEFEGTGLGLAIVQRIIDRHGGRVWAESAKGEGATFYFSLPVASKRY